MKPTKDGVSPLQFFDGATMKAFAFPTKASEIVFCRRFPDLTNCKSGHGFVHERENIPISALALQPIDGAEDNRGTGVFATRGIPRMSYIGLEGAVHRVYVKSYTSELLQKLSTSSLASIKKAASFIEIFGRQQRKSVSNDTFEKVSQKDNIQISLKLCIAAFRIKLWSRLKQPYMRLLMKDARMPPMWVNR